jgi:hypothetical protein
MAQVIATEVTVRVPEKLYKRLSQRAHQTQRAVEDELLATMATGLSVSDELPSSLEDELAQLNVLSDESLWRIARSRLNPLQAAKLERLHLKAQRQPLTATERKQEQIVVHEYERVLLLRARAARLLKDHGIDISSLFN